MKTQPQPPTDDGLDPDDDSVSAPARTPDLSRGLQAPADLPTRSHPNRSPAMRLPADPGEAAALVAAFVQRGEASFDRSSAIEAMNARVARLTDPDADPSVIVAELAAHAAVLDSLFLRWVGEAMRAQNPDHKATFARLALSSQASCTRSLLAVAGLKEQAAGRARIVLDAVGNVDDER